MITSEDQASLFFGVDKPNEKKMPSAATMFLPPLEQRRSFSGNTRAAGGNSL